jgi:hypothetical protein
MELSTSDVTALQRTDLSNKVQVAVARKVLDTAQAEGEAMVELIRAAGAAGGASSASERQSLPAPVVREGRLDGYA